MMNANADMLLYDLHPDYEKRLREIEADVVNLLLENHITERAIWTVRYGPDSSYLQLIVPGSPEPKILFEMPRTEFDRLSAEKVLSKIRQSF